MYASIVTQCTQREIYVCCCFFAFFASYPPDTLFSFNAHTHIHHHHFDLQRCCFFGFIRATDARCCGVPRKHMPVPGGVRGCNLIAIKMVLIEISNHDVRSFVRSLSLSSAQAPPLQMIPSPFGFATMPRANDDDSLVFIFAIFLQRVGGAGFGYNGLRGADSQNFGNGDGSRCINWQ